MSLLLRSLLLLALCLGCRAGTPAPADEGTPDKPKDKAPDRKDRPGDKGKPKEKERELDTNDLNLEMLALHTLHFLQPTAEQLGQVADLARKITPREGARPEVKASPAFRAALEKVRGALAGGDPEQVDAALQKLDELREKEAPEFELVEITDEARTHAPGLLKAFSARQVVGFVAGLADDFPDPLERLRLAIQEARSAKDEEWRTLRDNTSEDVGQLVGGLDSKAEARVRDEAKALLNKARRLEDKEFEAEKATLDRAARALCAPVGPTDVVRHYLERSLAEMLSNPRLPRAVELRRKHAK